MSKIIDKVLSYTIVGLTFAILFIVLIAAAITLPGLRELFRHEYASPEFIKAVNGDGLKYLSSFVVSCGVLVALLTYLREKKKQAKELEERRSHFFFEQAKTGLEEVFDLLKDQDNDRIKWIRAARDLLHSVNLSKQITTSEYKEAYRLVEEKIRHKLTMALSVYDKDTKEWNALPPQFFYGLKDWQVPRPLDEAAKIASQKIVVQDVSIDRVLRQPTSLPLSEKSVVAIYDFLEYPKEYEDPLGKVTIWRSDWEGRYGIDQGARRFVYHKSRHIAIDGKLHRIDKQEDTTGQTTS
jgi:hypothetical protein